MARIVITEFMDERAVAQLRAAHDVLYDPKLVDDAPRLLAEAAGATPSSCATAPRCAARCWRPCAAAAWSAGWAWAWTTSTCRPARRAACR
jgi:hypothetical protein